MKRKILLFMMTALLSVGAWAQSLWTKTLFEGSQEISSSSPLTIAKSELQGARIGSQICIYMDLSVPVDQWGDNIIYYEPGWYAVSMNPGTEIVAKGLLDATIVNGSEGLTIKPQNSYSTCTVTKVTLNYNGANLLSSESGISPNIWSNAVQLKKGLFAYATEGDVLSVNVSAIDNDGWKKIILTSGQGNPEDMRDAVNVYNDTPSETEIALPANSFTDIVVGSYIRFTTTIKGIEAKSSGNTLASNLYWDDISFYVTDENISTIQDNGINVTVTTTESNTLTVTKQNPKDGTPTGYWRTGDLTEGEKVNIPLTSALLGHAREGEGDGNLYLSGYSYSTTSVDLIYQPSVNIGSTGYATFGYPFAVDLSGLSDGQNAYTVTVNGDKAQLTSVKGNKIPANTGIILKGTSGDKISLPLTTASTDAIGTNDLQVSDGTVTGDENGTIYVLANGGSNGVGFYPVVNGSAITAGKAYLKVSGENAARQFIGFGDDNGATGIDSLTPALSKGEEVYYDLQGRRVAQPTKGLYIVNGKKVIIK